MTTRPAADPTAADPTAGPTADASADVRPTHPVTLPANQPPERFYRGGARIAEFRGEPVTSERVPEDWVGSTTTLFGEPTLGLSPLPRGDLLADAVAADPVHWLGAEHVAASGPDTALLVKLLDAGERLPVHAHPDVPFAGEHLGLAHGKTEAWIALADADVHLAFARDVTADELDRWVATQDTAAMLGAMHRLHVRTGDAVLVPAGLPHAIGAGAFVVELQEPTDLSILLEWDGFAIDGPRDGHLGLGHATALRAVDRRGWSSDEVAGLVQADASTVGSLLPGGAAFFRADRVRGDDRWEPSFAVVVVTAGTGTLVAADGTRTPLRAGATLVVPHAAGSLDVVAGADLELVRCRPPLPA
ncbi:mannose-6-phosphate isomerase [Cellulomonas algicola]|uniref:Mannose-6-phosphate isomerase n=1 Tax=Cellulomonas algicola TaxID=2071633 RepID=A0A401V5B4_9CELL|nr:class I mannose-6-phosphate isomerase [Cellulomonas algicola]GCD22120.1 mannose-6-phosphate isomerase [Cellulomonas algicola]